MYTNVYTSFVHNAKNWEQPKCSSAAEWTNCGTLLINKKKPILITTTYMRCDKKKPW